MTKNKKIAHKSRAVKKPHRGKVKSKVIRKIQKVKKPRTRKIIALKVPVVKVVDIVETPRPRTRKRRSKNVTRMYFTQETEDAIIAYNLEENQDIRECIFQEKILLPFQKLVENVFNTFKFSYFETGPQDVQKECLTHLVANMHKFDPSRCSKSDPKKKTKAYSYFSIIAKHYLILLNNTNYKKFNQNIEISEERNENTVQLQADDKYYAQQEMLDFVRLIINYWDKNVDKIFTKQRDLNIAKSIVELIRNSNRLEMFNKKAIYLMIREISDCRTQQITKVINKMKQYQKDLCVSYRDNGDIDVDKHSPLSKTEI